MEFLKFIRSLEALLYEVMAWLVFYPRTLWRVLRHPLALAARVEAEMSEKAEDPFNDLVSPPLFLVLSILLAHALEISLYASLAPFTSGMSKEVPSSDTSLLIFRALTFSLFALQMACGLLRRQRREIDRHTLRQPFFLQCFFASPFVLTLSLASVFGRLGLQLPAAVLAIGSIVWYLGVEVEWFRTRLGIGRLRAFGIACRLALVAFLLAFGIAFLTLGPAAQ